MKIAKKVLAVAMAVAMIACCALMASAALKPDAAKFELVLNGTDVKLYAKDCIGLASADVHLAFDSAVVKAVRVTSGADSKNVNADNFENNSFTSEYNNSDLADVAYSFYFKEYLWNSEKFAAEDFSGEANINAENFHIATFRLTLVEGKTAEDVVVGIKVNASFTDDTKEVEKVTDLAATGIEKKAEETTAAPEETTAAPEETTAAEAPSTPDETTNPGVVEGPNTGDTGVLAIAAGVVALAGAAFVVSKKRK